MDWRQEDAAGFDAVLPLPEIGAELPFAQVYERVRFEAGEPRAEA